MARTRSTFNISPGRATAGVRLSIGFSCRVPFALNAVSSFDSRRALSLGWGRSDGASRELLMSDAELLNRSAQVQALLKAPKVEDS